jgi:hypothetical protein
MMSCSLVAIVPFSRSKTWPRIGVAWQVDSIDD